MRTSPRRILLRSVLILLTALGLVSTVAYSASAWNVQDANTKITKVSINGQLSDVTVAPNSTINITLNYAINRQPCRLCQWQIEVGYANEAAPNQCIFDGFITGTRVARGTANFSMTAPSSPGSYFLAFDIASDFSCLETHAGWWDALDPQANYFAHITVK